jgi:hypothetical protein
MAVIKKTRKSWKLPSQIAWCGLKNYKIYTHIIHTQFISSYSSILKRICGVNIKISRKRSPMNIKKWRKKMNKNKMIYIKVISQKFCSPSISFSAFVIYQVTLYILNIFFIIRLNSFISYIVTLKLSWNFSVTWALLNSSNNLGVTI